MNLCKGIAVIIDNQIGEEKQIDTIIKRIHDAGIPTSQFKDLNSANKALDHFLMINFLILDWKMFDIIQKPDGVVTPGSVAKEDAIKSVIDFIENFKKNCFSPIFIFTTEAEQDISDQIIPKLKERGLYYDDEGKNYIHVKNKSEVLKDDILRIIKEWINKWPSIYVMKSWQKEFLKAYNEVCWNLYNKSPDWPTILWKNFEEEKEEPNSGISDTIYRLIIAKTQLKNMERDIIINESIKSNLEEIRNVIRETMFQEGEFYGVKPGDIYKKDDSYYINIRPECDTIEGRSFSEFIYLIKGKKISQEQLKKCHDENIGFLPKISEAFVFFIDCKTKDVIKFNFKDFSIVKHSDYSQYRICRLLPPFITVIQQRFSSFVGRFGIPRLPKEIEEDILK